MNETSWNAKTRDELIIEVWEKLDCESIGSAEVQAIETAVEGAFGPDAVQPPMVMARVLADEGAELRHSELMELHLRRISAQTYEPSLLDIVRADDLSTLLIAVRRLDGLRRNYVAEGNKKGVRSIKDAALEAKENFREIVERRDARPVDPDQYVEMVSWITLWLQSSELFEQWLSLRIENAEFKDRFGDSFRIPK